MSAINAPVITNAVMLDRVIGEIQQGLVDNLSWLDAAFGRSQRLTKMMNGKRIITPNVFCGGWNNHGENDYIEVSPDSKIGNFSFFEVDDPQTIDSGPWARTVTVPYSLIFWFDLRRVYNEASNRNIEYLKAQVLHFLNGRMGWRLQQGRITVSQIYDRVENIYRGYSLSEIDNQFLMHPFAGFRISGNLIYDELCYSEIGPGPIPPTPVVPVVPSDALTFESTRFALGEVGNGQLFRVRGNSIIKNGSLVNAMITGWDVIGGNQIDPEAVRIEYEFGNPYLVSPKFRIIPNALYSIGVVGASPSDASLDVYISKDGIEFTHFYGGDSVIAFQMPDEEYSMAYVKIGYDREYQNNLFVYLYDGQSEKALAYYTKSLNLDVANLSGYDESDNLVSLFPNGLMAAGNDVRDEIYNEGVAVRKVGVRDYQNGDENNSALLTDGVRTHYPLPTPEIYTIAQTIDLSFVAEKGGTIFQNPEDVTALLDIVIE